MPVRVVEVCCACGHHNPPAGFEGVAVYFEVGAELSDGVGGHAKSKGFDEDRGEKREVGEFRDVDVEGVGGRFETGNCVWWGWEEGS